MPKTIVQVRIVPLVSPSELHPDDAELSQEVDISIDSDVPQEKIADAALDVFHNEVPVACLDDFEFSVFLNGSPLETDPNHAGYSLKHDGEIIS